MKGLLPVFREALAVHAIYAAAGIRAADVFVTPAATSPEGQSQQLGVIARQGDREFIVTVGPVSMPPESFAVQWPRAAAIWNELSPDGRKRLVEGAVILSRGKEILSAMSAKGFER